METKSTDIRAIAAALTSGAIDAAQAETMRAARVEWLLRTIEDGIKFRAWQAARKAQQGY